MRPLMWFMSVLLTMLVVGCGGGGGGSSGVATTSDKAITAFSVLGVSGTVNEAAKTIAITVPNGTDVTALVATFTSTGGSVKVGAAIQTSGVTANDFTNPVVYTVTATDGTTTTYTVAVNVASLTAKAITAYAIAGVAGVINEAGKIISVTLPAGSSVTAQVATFSTTGTNVSVGATTQVSATTANDFTTPVNYVVTAADASTTTYTVTVVVASPTAKAITAYSLAGVAGVINEVGKTISVTLPSGSNVTALVATFTMTGASINVGATAQVSGTTVNNFTSPVSYVVTAADASTATYVVTVSVASTTAKAITAFSLAGVAGTINEAGKTIAVALPSGTNVTALVATFTTTGASVHVGATAQVSGATANNFTSPVSYIVTAADASTATYVVTATVAAAGPAPVVLGMAGNYAIFTDTGISNATFPAAITGDMGVGPGVTSTAITGFALVLPAASPFSTSTQVTGNVYAFDYAAPTPTDVTTASNDMGFAYDDAAGRLLPDFTDLFVGGNIGGQTLAPGLYRWNSAVTVPFGTNVTFAGGPNDVWIIQVTGTLDLAANTQVLLTGGALPKNIFWQVAGAVTLGASSHLEGVVLAKTAITLGSLATANSRLLAQTRVNLDQNTVTQPLP